MSVSLVKEKLLAVAHSGAYSLFTPSETRALAGQLDVFLRDHSSDKLTPLEYYDLLELQFYLTLISNEDKKAKSILDQLQDQFSSKDSQRLKLMKSIYLEAIGQSTEAIEALKGNKDEMRLARRMATFARKADNNEGYIKNLVSYLDLQPLDTMAWDELSFEYSKVGAYNKSVFCLEEIVLQDPLAYQCFYKIGLNNYYWGKQLMEGLWGSSSQGQPKKEKIVTLITVLSSARDNWLRCIEIFPKHTKSWVGIYLILNESFILKLNKWVHIREVEQFISHSRQLTIKAESTIKKLEGISDDNTFHELISI
ncbi:uncharacterized protein KQ657_003165 [Scheffersomyces spartinae]|uniref:ER membrane protein complex subunit 2 n=1 Tax=Scheffersomyces spartinae TaxID=45513 RepID=A0A9P8AK12_9ASCO|nr:uncharacterized protein KQ657_003165 [Scheffersomyces spartinae]KAG7195407.1 hypothetical protein KQ657_003165 [Scheffersomyces spartinae]